MCYLPAILGSSLALATPDCDTDFKLLVGLRSVIATSIELDGLPCAQVVRIEEGRFDDEGGRILKVVCAVPGPSTGSDDSRTYRVVAYTEGDFEAAPWASGSRALAGVK